MRYNDSVYAKIFPRENAPAIQNVDSAVEIIDNDDTTESVGDTDDDVDEEMESVGE